MILRVRPLEDLGVHVYTAVQSPLLRRVWHQHFPPCMTHSDAVSRYSKCAGSMEYERWDDSSVKARLQKTINQRKRSLEAASEGLLFRGSPRFRRRSCPVRP